MLQQKLKSVNIPEAVRSLILPSNFLQFLKCVATLGLFIDNKYMSLWFVKFVLNGYLYCYLRLTEFRALLLKSDY